MIGPNPLELRKLLGQHRVIVRLAVHLNGLSACIRTRRDAQECRLEMDRLDRVLARHLAHEDKLVMPRLIDSADPKTRALAQDCVEEMGSVAQLWRLYIEQWTVEAIQGASDRFAAATRVLTQVIVRRVEREERYLYPSAMAAGDTAA